MVSASVSNPLIFLTTKKQNKNCTQDLAGKKCDAKLSEFMLRQSFIL